MPNFRVMTYFKKMERGKYLGSYYIDEGMFGMAWHSHPLAILPMIIDKEFKEWNY